MNAFIFFYVHEQRLYVAYQQKNTILSMIRTVQVSSATLKTN